MQKRLITRQLFDTNSSTYTYILGDPEVGDAVLIDSVLERVNRDLQHLEEMGLSLKYTLETHIHADHITGSGEVRKRTGCAIVAGDATQLKTADRLLSDGEELSFGTRSLKAIATPGHTRGCTSYYTPGMLFCGDTLLIRSCGRTDFQGGDPSSLYESIKKKLYKLPPDTVVYPGHDYLGQTNSSLQEEMKYNKRIPLIQKKRAFVQLMNTLDLPYPKKIDYTVPANQHSGDVQHMNISADNLSSNLRNFTLVDVRSKAEYESGHIEGAILATLGPNLKKYLNAQEDTSKTYVFICRIGRRSSQAAEIAKEHGFQKVFNLTGGMTDWTKKGFPVVRGIN